MATLGDMDRDYTWRHGPWLHLGTWTVTTLGDMDRDYTWGHGL